MGRLSIPSFLEMQAHLIDSIVPELERVRGRLPETHKQQWYRCFLKSGRAFAEAQLELSKNLEDGVIPTLPEYLRMRKELYGSSMFVDLLDLLEITSHPTDLSSKERMLLEQFSVWTKHIVAWVLVRSSISLLKTSFNRLQDIFSYASGPTGSTRCNSHNLISLLTRHKNLSVQGAMNYSGGMIREALEELQRLEAGLLPGTLGGSPTDSSASWGWFGLGGLVKSAVGLNDHPRPHWKFLVDVPMDYEYFDEGPDDPLVDLTQEQLARKNAKIARYITAMKDWIIGTIHWGYETGLYFGQKGDEVRSFGWVFLAHNDHSTNLRRQ